MKFTVTREALLNSLLMISGVVEKRQTMPVLANVLLEVSQEEGLVLTGTNMEVELISRVAEVTVEEAGRITVPARKFADICRALPDSAELRIELKESRLTIHTGKSHFTLSTLPADNFPNVEEESGSIQVDFRQKDLKELIDATSFAMAQQDVRYYLNGLLLELQTDTCRAVATDGHRLAMSELKVTTGIPEVRQVIVPRKGILELGRLLQADEESCSLTFGSNHLRARIGQFTFTSKLIDGKFPDYQRVVPRNGNKEVIADRLLLKGVLSRASILSHENIRGIRLELQDGEVRVFANNPDQEEAEDSLEVEYEGEQLQIGFNVSYLIDVLNVMDDNLVKITLANPNSSALIESVEHSGALYVVMPMRL